MKTLLKYTIIAVFSILILNSCGSDTGGSSNPPSIDFAPKTAGGFDDAFIGRTITAPSGNKVTILENKQGRYFISNQLLSGSYIYSYVTTNTATIKHTIGGITCNQTVTFASHFAGRMNETCRGSNGVINNINQVANGDFSSRNVSQER